MAQQVKKELEDPRAAQVEASTTRPGASSAALQRAFERLGELTRLGPNWDSYGAEPISPQAIALARQFLTAVAERFAAWAGDRVHPYVIVPLANGGVQLEWRGPGGDLEVEIGPAGDFAYLLITGQGAARTFEERDAVPEAELFGVVARAGSALC